MTIQQRIDHVSLVVSDLEVSAAFYRDVLGLSEVAIGAGRPQFRWFGINEVQALYIGKDDPREPRLKKGTHVALRADNFDEVLARLNAKGIAYGIGPAHRERHVSARMACTGST